MDELFSKCVFISEYDCFCGWDVIIDGVSMRDTPEGKQIIEEIEDLSWYDYAEYFKKKFPDKIVVYNCDGHYTFFIDGKKIEV